MKSTRELARELGLLRKRSASSLVEGNSKKSKNSNQIFDYLIVLDFESTCWQGEKHRTQEIIEFPCVLLNTSNGEIESEFQRYVQPQENPILSDFCKELTGIRQDQVDEGIPLSLCLRHFTTWLKQLTAAKNLTFQTPTVGRNCATFVTWSDWDLAVCLNYECRRKQLRKPIELDSWIDLRATYRKFYERRPQGLNGALKEVGITFEGREHSGLHDSRNTARLAWRMICDGCALKITKSNAKTCIMMNKENVKSSTPVATIGPMKSSISGTTIGPTKSSISETTIGPSKSSTQANSEQVDTPSKSGNVTNASPANIEAVKSIEWFDDIADEEILNVCEYNLLPGHESSPSSRNKCELKKTALNNILDNQTNFARKDSPKQNPNLSPRNTLKRSPLSKIKNLMPSNSALDTLPSKLVSKTTSLNQKNVPISNPTSNFPKSVADTGTNSKPRQNNIESPPKVKLHQSGGLIQPAVSHSPGKNPSRVLKELQNKKAGTASIISKPSQILSNEMTETRINCTVKSMSSNVENNTITASSTCKSGMIFPIKSKSNINGNAQTRFTSPNVIPTRQPLIDLRTTPSNALVTPNMTRSISFDSCPSTGSSLFKTPGSANSNSSMHRTPPMCFCGSRAKRKFVQSPGPNVGRVFFCCGMNRKSPRSGCKFFQWEVSSNSDQNSNRQGSTTICRMSPMQQPNFETPISSRIGPPKSTATK